MNYHWLDKEEYPFTSHFLTIDEHQLHYLDEGQGEVLLFVHGTPSWSFDFRKLILSLRNNYRCVALDHIGFGLSDKPENYDYRTIRHSMNLQKLIEHLQLKNISLIAHDFGGPIAMNYAVHHPENIHRITLLNTWLWSSEGEPEFEKFKKILKSPLLPFLYKRLNFSPRFLLPSSFGEKKLPRKIRKQYTSPFRNSSERYGTLAFAQSLLNDQPWFEEIWNKKVGLQNKPFLFIWGMKDKFVTEKYLRKFEEAFPQHTTLELTTCGHFPQEEEQEKTLESILRFLKSNNSSSDLSE